MRFAKQLARAVVDDGITDVAAMMAYYTLLALFPMLVFVITVALLVIDPQVIYDGVGMALEAVPPSVHGPVEQQITSFVSTASAGFALGGAALALWGASRGAAALGTALNTIFAKRETRGWFHRQAIAIAVTVGVALLVVVALGILVIGPIAGHYVADRFGLGGAFDVAWGVARWLGAGLLVMVVWALAYKFLPDTDAPFRIFTPGAIVGVLLWLGTSALFGLYLRHFNSYDATYGALGGAIIFITWLWLSNIALLFGAEINDVLADWRKHESAAAAQLADTNEKRERLAPSA
jgi:membrane protein